MAENINIPSGSNNLRNALVDMLASKNMDMKMRRVIDASPAQDPNDYVILKQLTDTQNTLQQNIDSNSKDITTIKNQIKNPTPTSSILYVQPSANLTLTTSAQNVPGLTLTLNKIGAWLIIATIGFQQTGSENNAAFVAQINIDGGAVSPGIYFFTPNVTGQTTTASGGSVASQYLYNATTQPHTITVQAYKTTGSGTSLVGQSALSALWVSS